MFFQDHPYTVYFRLSPRPSGDYSSYSVKLTYFKTIQKRKRTFIMVQDSKSEIWTPFKTIHEAIKDLQDIGHMDSYLIISCTIDSVDTSI